MAGSVREEVDSREATGCKPKTMQRMEMQMQMQV
jgi:hypothetical protein